jgi:hypothetical protein
MVFNNRRIINIYKEMDFLTIRHYGLRPTSTSNDSKKTMTNERNLLKLLNKTNKRIDANDNDQLLDKPQVHPNFCLTNNKRYLNLSQLSRYSQREETPKDLCLNAKSYRTLNAETPQLMVSYAHQQQKQQQRPRKKVPSLYNEKRKIVKGLSLRDSTKPLPKLNDEMILMKRIDENDEDKNKNKFSLKVLLRRK